SSERSGLALDRAFEAGFAGAASDGAGAPAGGGGASPRRSGAARPLAGSSCFFSPGASRAGSSSAGGGAGSCSSGAGGAVGALSPDGFCAKQPSPSASHAASGRPAREAPRRGPRGRVFVKRGSATIQAPVEQRLVHAER